MKFFRYGIALIAALGSLLGFAVLATAQIMSVTSASVQATPIQCPIVPAFMKQGIANDTAAVTRLQQFLKNSENLDVDVSGTFDAKTEAAVEAFQKKYADSILTPWGATKASGIVYITTAKKINQLACAQAMTLDQNELTTMANYQASTTSAPTASVAVVQEADPVVTYPSDSGDTQSAPMVGPSLSASVVLAPGASLMSKFGFYLSHLF